MTSSTILNKKRKSDHPCHVPDFRRNVWMLMVCWLCVRFLFPLLCWNMLPFILRILNMKRWWILSKTHSVSNDMILWNLSFSQFLCVVWKCFPQNWLNKKHFLLKKIKLVLLNSIIFFCYNTLCTTNINNCVKICNNTINLVKY